MGSKFSSKYGLFGSAKVEDKKRLVKNCGIFLVLRRKTGMPDGVKVGSVSVSPRGDLRLPAEIEPEEFMD